MTPYPQSSVKSGSTHKTFEFPSNDKGSAGSFASTSELVGNISFKNALKEINEEAEAEADKNNQYDDLQR